MLVVVDKRSTCDICVDVVYCGGFMFNHSIEVHCLPFIRILIIPG